MGAATMAALLLRAPVGATGQAASIESPTRVSREPPPIAAAPPLAKGATTLPRLTFEVETTRSGPQGTRRTTQRVTRSHDRVWLALPGGRQEWLFEQNVVYRERVSGYLIDHDAREIRFHDESPLRSRLHVRGWLDILTIRFDPTVLATLRDTGERRVVEGTRVVRFAAASPRRDGLAEVWWSEEWLLPMAVTMRGTGLEVTSRVHRLTRGGDDAVLADPAARFPGYKRLDAGDAGDH